VLKALARSVSELRLKVYSNDADEERIIAPTPISGAMPPSTGQPLVYAVVSNVLGNKMDYYLQRTVTYNPPACGRGARITITLTNTGPASGLPTEVASQFHPADRHYGEGTDVDRTSVYIDGSSVFDSASVDGKQTFLEQGFEEGLTVLTTQLVMKPGASSTLVIDLSKRGASKAAPRFVVQPLVIPQESRVLPQQC
jgi:hypothetical protein